MIDLSDKSGDKVVVFGYNARTLETWLSGRKRTPGKCV